MELSYAKSMFIDRLIFDEDKQEIRKLESHAFIGIYNCILRGILIVTYRIVLQW
jgi:hypothetical protein